MRPARGSHSSGHRPAGHARLLHGRAQQRELADEIRENGLKALPRPLDGSRDGLRLAVRADHEVDRPVLEMPAPVREAGA
jgi:hypothetical protein